MESLSVSAQLEAQCPGVHPLYRYSGASATWVLMASILIFFMKAGFMLMEASFVADRSDRRSVILFKYLDTCASALAFFAIGYSIAKGNQPLPLSDTTDMVQFFFKFTFASNAATIIGGTLCGQNRKMRTIAIPIYAFMISGFIHPMVARWVWGDGSLSDASDSPKNSLSFLGAGFMSPFHKRYCRESYAGKNYTDIYIKEDNFYVLDFAGGGAVHLLGGIAGLSLMLILKLDDYVRTKYSDGLAALVPMFFRKLCNRPQIRYERVPGGGQDREVPTEPSHFLDWMYPEHGGKELHIEDSALGVLILWTTWFAFNLGSTESVEASTNVTETFQNKSDYAWMYYNVPGRIAVNMILCTGSAGLVAVLIAGCAQLRNRSHSTNVNEIANGILGALVAITSGCPFVSPGWAIGIGAISILVYHLGCYLEYIFNLKDTARVFPVHGVCGLWSMIAPGILVERDYVNQAYNGVCYCEVFLPHVEHWERFLYQLAGAAVIIIWSLLTCSILFFVLSCIPIQWMVTGVAKILRIHDPPNSQAAALIFKGGMLLTRPDEFRDHDMLDEEMEIGRKPNTEDNEFTPLLQDNGNPTEVVAQPEDETTYTENQDQYLSQSLKLEEFKVSKRKGRDTV